MSDAGAAMLIQFVQRGVTADSWLARWLALSRGSLAVRLGFEAAHLTGELSEPAQNWLIVTASASADPNVAARLAQKTSKSNLEAIAERLQQTPTTGRYPDATQGKLGEIIGDPLSVPQTPETAEDLARLLTLACAVR